MDTINPKCNQTNINNQISPLSQLKRLISYRPNPLCISKAMSRLWKQNFHFKPLLAVMNILRDDTIILPSGILVSIS